MNAFHPEEKTFEKQTFSIQQNKHLKYKIYFLALAVRKVSV